MKITSAQHHMLQLIARHADPGSGWAEVETHFLNERCVPRYLEAAVCKNVGDALVRKGLITDDEGPRLTDLGRKVVAAGARP